MPAAAIVLLFALAEAPSTCSQPNLVTVEVSDVPLIDALRTIGTQSSVSIGVRKGFEGRVTAKLRCVKPRFALEFVLSQVNGAICDEGGVLRVDRTDRIVCRGQRTIPPRAHLVRNK